MSESVDGVGSGTLAGSTCIGDGGCVLIVYMAEAGLLAGLELAVQLVVVLVHVLQEVRSQGQREWMRKIGVDHNTWCLYVCLWFP